jgi:hypothetical protein
MSTRTIEALTKVAARHDADIDLLVEASKNVLASVRQLAETAKQHEASIQSLVDGTLELRKQWEAHLRTLPKQ